MKDALLLAKGLRQKTRTSVRQARQPIRMIMPKKRCLDAIVRYKDIISNSRPASRPSTTSITERISDRDVGGGDSEDEPPPPLLILEERELRQEQNTAYHLDDTLDADDSPDYSPEGRYNAGAPADSEDNAESTPAPDYSMQYAAPCCWSEIKHWSMLTSDEIKYTIELIDKKLEEVLDL